MPDYTALLEEIREELRLIYNGQIDVESCLDRIEERLKKAPTPFSDAEPQDCSPLRGYNGWHCPKCDVQLVPFLRAQPCPTCGLKQYSGLHRHPMAPTPSSDAEAPESSLRDMHNADLSWLAERVTKVEGRLAALEE